jgi:hypothetical protein
MGALEVLHGALVFLGRLARSERAEVFAFAGCGVQFPGVETVFAGFQFADHAREIAGIVP